MDSGVKVLQFHRPPRPLSMRLRHLNVVFHSLKKKKNPFHIGQENPMNTHLQAFIFNGK